MFARERLSIVTSEMPAVVSHTPSPVVSSFEEAENMAVPVYIAIGNDSDRGRLWSITWGVDIPPNSRRVLRASWDNDDTGRICIVDEDDRCLHPTEPGLPGADLGPGPTLQLQGIGELNISQLRQLEEIAKKTEVPSGRGGSAMYINWVMNVCLKAAREGILEEEHLLRCFTQGSR